MTYIGVVYLCEASSEAAWTFRGLREEISGNVVLHDCFAFVPAFIYCISQENLGKDLSLSLCSPLICGVFTSVAVFLLHFHQFFFGVGLPAYFNKHSLFSREHIFCRI